MQGWTDSMPEYSGMLQKHYTTTDRDTHADYCLCLLALHMSAECSHVEFFPVNMMALA